MVFVIRETFAQFRDVVTRVELLEQREDYERFYG